MMKPIVVFSALLVLMLISGKDLQHRAVMADERTKEFAIIVPADNKENCFRHVSVESDQPAMKSEKKTDPQTSPNALPNLMSGKYLTNVFIFL